MRELQLIANFKKDEEHFLNRFGIMDSLLLRFSKNKEI